MQAMSTAGRDDAPLVTLRGAGARRPRGGWRVRDVSLSVAPGEIVTLIGPNGSGKSTTVRLALGLVEPDEGEVVRRPGLSVGYVPQELGFDANLPLDVTRFMRLTRPLKAVEIAAALETVGAEDLARAQLRDLSGGERQRVLLARAVAGQPDLLVLDEPVQGVDFAGEARLYELIDAIRQELGCGVLLISHDLHVVMARTTRVVCLNGHVCCQGAPAEVLASAGYRSLYGLPTDAPLAGVERTHALYRHEHDHTHEH